MNRLIVAMILVAIGVVRPVGAQGIDVPLKRGAGTISDGDLHRHLFVIADDSMGGRDTPSRGLELTADYVAEQFRKAGFRPGGDSGSYIQRYPIGSKASAHPTPTVGEPARTPATAPNVVGILEGSDPVLRNEYVLFSAHMDHIGMRRGVGPDSIWNGADDDASGTVGVIALAEAFATAPPKRSVILLTVSGEEKGLWGSDFFASHPPVPIDRIVADLNMDMIGRNWKDTIVVIGKEHSDLGVTLNRVNEQHPELSMHAIDDPWPQERFYFRSDHFNFARRGVPILFFFNGTHTDYHEASDSPDRIDYEKEARIIQLVFYVGEAVANSPARPVWNPESYKKIVGARK